MEDEEEEEAGREGKKEGALVKNAPLATSYLHKLSYCALPQAHGNNLEVRGGKIIADEARFSFLSKVRARKKMSNKTRSPPREDITTVGVGGSNSNLSEYLN